MYGFSKLPPLIVILIIGHQIVEKILRLTLQPGALTVAVAIVNLALVRIN